MTSLSTKIASAVAVLAGAAGIGVVLYAWRLPPFDNGVRVTDNAYVEGRITTLSPQLAGYIVEIAVADFEEVEKGQLILKLDDRIYQEKLAQANAELAAQQAALSTSDQNRLSAEARIKAAEATVAAAKVTRDNAGTNDRRQQDLNARGVSARANLDNADVALSQAQAAQVQAGANLEVARQELQTVISDRATLEAGVQRAQAAVQLATIDLSNTRIIAPVAGKLGAVGARLGAYVGAGTQLTSIVTPERWVVANFKETQLRGMYVGMPVTMVLDVAKDVTYQGRIQSFSPASGSEFSVLKPDNATGNFTKVVQRLPVKILFDESGPAPDLALVAPGLSVTVTVAPSTPPPDQGDAKNPAP